MSRGRFFLAGALALLAASRAYADSPSLSRILPRGGQIGTELDVVFSGSRLKDAQEVFFYQPGLEVLKLEVVNEASVKVRLKIAPDAPLGEHMMRLRTATGISELRTFWVGTYPTVEEKEPNSDFKQPQKIDFNVTVAGVVEAEDVDYFLVEAKKGQRITAEVEGVRLGVTLLDTYLAIFDMKRFELAVCDDAALLLQDPVVSILAPEDGTYVIQLRESSYGGSGDGYYRLHVGTFPRPLAVYPPGGKAGEKLAVTYVGDVKGALMEEITLPGAPVPSFRVYAREEGRMSPSPNYLRVSEFPNVLETEPNDARAAATATDLPLPLALNGVIGNKGDEDWFRFKAKKGETFDIRVYARALRSPLDAVLQVLTAGGNALGGNDDQGGPDPVVRFAAPADGSYEVRVRDHLGNGGPAYVYRVEFNAVLPSVATHIPEYEREPNGQHRQWVVVPKGNRFATWMRVNRVNCGGEMKLSFEGMPAGVIAHADPIAADIDRVPVVFEAAADAKVAGSLADVVARHADPQQQIAGGFRQNVSLVFGPPNNTIFYAAPARKLAVAVAEEAPYKINIVEPKVPLVQGGSMNLKVTVERKPGFDVPITLRLLWTPPGLGAQGSIAIEQGKSEAFYPINANGGAGLRTWKIAILGSADGPNGTVWCSTQLMPITVGAPYVAMQIAMAATEQGKPAEIVCKLDQLKPFEGKAKVVLYGLPPKVTADATEKEITKDDKEVVFSVKTDPTSPAGQHKSLFCQVIVVDKNEPMAHNVGGGGILRIDLPPPPKKGEPLLKPEAAKKPDAAVKRLSRLEQLRLEAEERAKETKGNE